ncbi:hypothetical protein L6164_024128 [Bauhinia variegata]|uniref:Uncharacterized protein n=1 Tax=Bauhinia variegata TaxID=167791 RepID=A0ACB9LWU5_BAUVA|nr:hypothetical protein L6164_024128 [Bauhinia variegata]
MSSILFAHLFKNRFLVFITVLYLLLNVNEAENKIEPPAMPEIAQPIRPGKGTIIVILSVMFGLSFLLLAYVKFCRSSPLEILNRDTHLQNIQGLARSASRNSGIDKRVIEALPIFKFSSLKGSKGGLECAVCLSKFEDTEVLRLLPKCKHAFHMNCIDKWLEGHSSCPICRCRVDPVDINSFTYSISSRYLRVPSNLTEDPNLEIFVQREQDHLGSSRFNIGNIFCNVDKGRRQELLIDHGGDLNWKPVHKFNHRIVISNFVTRTRWSDLNSSDLLSLNTEMLNVMSSRRFSPLESPPNMVKFHRSSSLPTSSNEEENSFSRLNQGEKRSMSEIANVPRFAEISTHNRIKQSVGSSREERLRRIWLPIVRRTVQWFVRGDRTSTQSQHKRLAANV